MNLGDALPDGGNNQPRGAGVWGDSPAPAWPGASTAGHPIWSGGQPAGGGFWSPSQPSAPGPAPGPGPGGWPPAPGPGGWTPAPAPAPAPGPAPGPGGWPPAPAPAPGPWTPGPAPGGAIVVPQQNLVVPFSQKLSSGVYDKLLITIAGTIKLNADRITVDMSTSRDLAFHFNPRFNENGRQVIVRNSRFGQKWGPEERELPHFPFTRGRPFELKILCTNSEYKVAVDGSHLLTYRHRVTDLRSINTLNVYNDLSLSKVTMETLP